MAAASVPPAVRRRSGEAIDANRVAVRLNEPADCGELEARLGIAESPVGQTNPTLSFQLRDRSTHLERNRQRPRHMTARDGTRTVGEPRVALALQPRVQRRAY